MMGERRSGQDALFYEFSLERHVPAEHLLRSIDRFVDLDGVRCELAPFYSEMGRPSIDPELMIRMLIVGYCFGIRSERRLCEEVRLGYRWFCRLGLDGGVPDHSTFSKNRHGRFRDSDPLRKVFKTTVQRRQSAAQRAGWRMAITRGHDARRSGVSGGARRCRVWGSNPCCAEVHLARRPGLSLDGREWWPGFLCLLHQLPDRPEVCRHR